MGTVILEELILLKRIFNFSKISQFLLLFGVFVCDYMLYCSLYVVIYSAILFIFDQKRKIIY